MTRLTMRASAALLMALAFPGLHAQQVQVFSEGKPLSMVEEGNGTRLRVHDGLSSRRPLSDLAEAAAIASAHAAAFVRCGLNEGAYPPEKPIGPEERDYFVNNATYIPIKDSNKIILIGEFARPKAIVDLDKVAVITPQCPAGVRSLFWSHDTARMIFATQQVEAINFHGDSRALWTGKFSEPQDLWYGDSTHPGFRKLMSLPKERVLDIMLPDNADHVWVLSHLEKTDLRDPRKWLKAITGAPARKMDILLRKVNLDGATVETIIVATGVAAGSARFLRD